MYARNTESNKLWSSYILKLKEDSKKQFNNYFILKKIHYLLVEGVFIFLSEQSQPLGKAYLKSSVSTEDAHLVLSFTIII